MKLNFTKKLALSTTFLSALITTGISAHTLWINMSDYTPAYHPNRGAVTHLYMGWGHDYPADRFINADDFTDVSLISPSGKKEALTKEALTLRKDGYGETKLTLSEEGLYLIAITRRTALNTTCRENGKEIAIKGPKTGHNDIVSSVYSQQFAKSIFRSGNSFTGNISRPIGHTLEIVPLTNPFTLENNRSGRMKVKVLYKGKPLAFQKLQAMYEGYSKNDEASAYVSTNREGVAEIRIDHWGVWVIKTRLDTTPSDELKDKVNTERYFASLTFFVP